MNETWTDQCATEEGEHSLIHDAPLFDCKRCQETEDRWQQLRAAGEKCPSCPSAMLNGTECICTCHREGLA